jgi:hypothetical protein
MRRATGVLVVAVSLALAVAGCGDDDAAATTQAVAATPTVTDVWARASAAMQNAGAVYMTITGGSTDTALIAVSLPSDIAQMSMLHETAMASDGAMSMSPVTSIEIVAGSTVKLEPGGYHVMAMPLAQQLVAGETFDVTLTFNDGTQLTAQAEVRDE